MLPSTSASDGEAEKVVDDVLDLPFLLELLSELVARVEGRTGTKGVLPSFLETLLGDFPIDAADLSLRTAHLVDVGPKEEIPLPSATFRSHRNPPLAGSILRTV